MLQQWRGDASVPGTLLAADYDKEKELKKPLGVRTLSKMDRSQGRQPVAGCLEQRCDTVLALNVKQGEIHYG